MSKKDTAVAALNALESPEEFAAALESAADGCFQGAAECETAWQDTAAGKPWRELATVIRRSAVIQRLAREYR